MKTKNLFLLFILSPLLLVLSCNDANDPVNCTQEFVDGLRITVLNQNGQPLVEGVSVTAVDGAYSETLQSIETATYFSGAGERVGTYTVTVAKAGYQTYTSAPIVVTRDVCHVITQSLMVNLIAN